MSLPRTPCQPDPLQHDINAARDAWFLTGPTASGKSVIGLELAKRLNAEIISMDSMAVYQEMDIGTAKPSREDQERVPHHLIDLVEPSEEFSLPQYLEAAEQAIKDITSRRKVPLFVGGTPLYLTSLLRGVDSGPPPDVEFRNHWQSIAESQGNKAVHDRLCEIDPPSAKRLHPGDLRRVIRALEIYEVTGRPMSEADKHFSQPIAQQDCRVYLLEWPRKTLNARINARVTKMFDAGWLSEVQQLQQAGPLGRTAAQAVGYRQILEYLTNGGEMSQLIADVQTTTRRFAKRQRTWFRSLSEGRVVSLNAARSPGEVADEIVKSDAAQLAAETPCSNPHTSS
ncbi:MAG: tRNA (adenosine(37)-N6)-dimethylallyltransferase MiaA [Pirellulales bacterium]|nr:tRNA (adenosine(37)-N6)-dimethylallyltransferase MiaA [Pirellulales bacterium]